MSVPDSIIQYKLKQIITAQLEVMCDKKYITLNMLGITFSIIHANIQRKVFLRETDIRHTKERIFCHLLRRDQEAIYAWYIFVDQAEEELDLIILSSNFSACLETLQNYIATISIVAT